MVKGFYQKILFLIFPILFVGCEEKELDFTGTTSVPARFHSSHTPAVPPETKGEFREDDILFSEGGLVVVSVGAEPWPDDYLPQTRTNWGTTGTAVSWTQGDPVGIYMRYSSGTKTTANNVRYNAVNSAKTTSLTPHTGAVYFPVPARQSNMLFYAYYPYSSGSVTTNPIKTPTDSLLLNYVLPADQTLPATLRNCDIMCAASSVVNGANPNVSLVFNHKMVLISLQVTATIARRLNKATLSGNAVSGTGTLNLKTSALIPATSPTFSPYTTTNQTVGPLLPAYIDIIINPCTIGSNTLGGDLKVTLEFDGLLGSLLNKSAPLFSNKTLVGGTRYTYELSAIL